MSVDQHLRKHFWIVFGGLTVALGAVQAQAVSQWFGATLIRDNADGGSPSLPAPMPVAINTSSVTQKSTSAEPILLRNPFDSVTGRLNAPPVVEDAGTELEAGDPMSDPACEGTKITIIAASTDPEYSFASFAVADKTYMRRRGDELNGKKVYFIGWDRAWLTQGSQRCQVALFQPAAPVAPAGAVAPPNPVPDKRGGSTPDDIKKAIQKLSATEFNVDRSVIDKIKDNWADLMKFARSTPAKDENGKVIGQRLLGIRPDTVLAQLGMENGDVLTGINGFDMTDPTKMLEAYSRLATSPDVSISVQRGGKPVNVQYHMK